MTIDLCNAPKDCECSDQIHIVPHWLHEDRLAFEQNLRILQYPRGIFAGLAFAQNEAIRLQNKRYSMRRYTKDDQEAFIFPEGFREGDYSVRAKEALMDLLERQP